MSDLRELRLSPTDLWAVCARAAPFSSVLAKVNPPWIADIGGLVLVLDEEIDAETSSANRVEANAILEQLAREHPLLTSAYKDDVEAATIARTVGEAPESEDNLR